MKRVYKLLIVFISLLILTPVFLHYGLKDPLGNGKHIKNSLIQNFKKYEDVVIVVHSDKLDNYKDQLYKEVIYEEKKLTSKERAIILNELKNADTRTAIMAGFIRPMCGFRPHHRIEFKNNDNVTFSAEVCFMCDSAQTNDMKHSANWHGVKALRLAFKKINFETNRSWWKLATK